MAYSGKITRIPRSPRALRGPGHPRTSLRPQAVDGLAHPPLHRFLLVAAAGDPEWQKPREWIEGRGGLIVQGPNRAFPLDWLDETPDDFDLILIDCEYVGAFDDTVEYTLALRQNAPGVPVLLASRRFTHNDFSNHRSAICDCALKMPLSRSALFLGLAAAVDNRASRRATG